MIPVLTTMVALLTIAVCTYIVGREQDRAGDVTFASFFAMIAILVAVGGAAYTWKLSVEAGRDMAEAQRQIENIWQP